MREGGTYRNIPSKTTQRPENTHKHTLVCWIKHSVLEMFHYLLRQRQGELPPAKWSLPNRARPQARKQCTLRAADSSQRHVIKARRKNTGKNRDLDTENEATL